MAKRQERLFLFGLPRPFVGIPPEGGTNSVRCSLCEGESPWHVAHSLAKYMRTRPIVSCFDTPAEVVMEYYTMEVRGAILAFDQASHTGYTCMRKYQNEINGKYYD